MPARASARARRPPRAAACVQRWRCHWHSEGVCGGRPAEGPAFMLAPRMDSNEAEPSAVAVQTARVYVRVMAPRATTQAGPAVPFLDFAPMHRPLEPALLDDIAQLLRSG